MHNVRDVSRNARTLRFHSKRIERMMRRAIDQDHNEIIRQGIANLLAEIDAEIQHLDLDQDVPGDRIERLKRIMIDPPFLAYVKNNFQSPFPVVSIAMPTRNRAGV